MNQTEKKKKAILETTFQLLNEKEIKDITIDEIAQKAVVSKVTLFKYFKNKNYLMNLVILNAFEFMTQQIQEIIGSSLDFEATYRAITAMKLEQVKRFSLIFQENLMTQYTISPDFFEMENIQMTQLDIYRSLFQKGYAEGKIAADVTEEDFLFILHIFTEGMKGIEANFLFEKAEFLTRFFLNGFKKEE
ncbi:TetR/AcrR family transcriptional regulator [Lactococcus nasutitermitis]|uniref:TetR/AcrR family transcriptional regulator n=1 Tax=Lactococcus nasutitermitis TaxID=1652957 RepID=A0ABV9JEY3_9LACT|nr:TetR/AcrR family transcriptional regulator [Lactococcus nasutitermitis]